jgi:hypothetical protein
MTFGRYSEGNLRPQSRQNEKALDISRAFSPALPGLMRRDFRERVPIITFIG